MKLLRSILFSMLMGIAIAAQAMDQDVQVDLLMAKITNALKQNRVADALPAFAQLESMEPTLQNPLSEGFHFLYIDTLDKSGNHAKALSRANIYMEKFGKQGKYYDKVIEIMSRLQDQVAKNDKDIAEYNRQLNDYEIKSKEYQQRCYEITNRIPDCEDKIMDGWQQCFRSSGDRDLCNSRYTPRSPSDICEEKADKAIAQLPKPVKPSPPVN